jgi:hypothetical protein
MTNEELKKEIEYLKDLVNQMYFNKTTERLFSLEKEHAKMAKRLNQEIIIILLLLGYLFFFKG